MTSTPQGAWSRIHLADQLCDVFEPDRPNADGFAVLYLHDSDARSLQGRIAFETALAEYGLPLMAPSGGRGWWTDRPSAALPAPLTPERHVMENVLPAMEQRWNSRPPRAALLGIGMGGQGALRLAYRHPRTFPVVAAIAPVIDFQRLYDDEELLRQMYSDPEEARQDTATLWLHPLNWPRHQFFCCDPADENWEGADRLRMKLASIGILHECELETGSRQPADYPDAMAPRVVRFLAERLRSLR